MMRTRFVPDRAQGRPADIVLVSLVVLLAGLGLGILFSASYHRALSLFHDPYYFIYRQCIWAALGALAAFVVSKIPLNFILRVTPLILCAALFLMLLCFFPQIAPPLMGARRWIIVFGYSFQPSEFAKLALVMYLAFMLQKKADRLGDLINTFLPLVCVLLLFTALTFLQNDFSTSVFILALGISILFVAEIKMRYISALAGLTVAGGAVVLLFTKSHRFQRIITYLNPGQDPSGADYQILAARNALLKGGMWGTGIGQGTRKLGGLPEAHSDFIFAVLAEELGFLGVSIAVALFLLLAYKGYSIARSSGYGRYGFYLAFGITTCILGQALMNMAVVAGLVPATGVTLPFFSSGGTSLFVTLLFCGLLVNLSRPGEGALHG